MNTKWITDRLPTGREIRYGKVWVTDNFGYVAMVDYETIQLGTPWQPIDRPEPYVKPKRWELKWSPKEGMWSIYEGSAYRGYLNPIFTGDGAQRFEKILNEVMP